MTPTQQKKAIAFLKKYLKFDETMEAGDSLSTEECEKHTTAVRVFLIEVGGIPDRRKAGK